MHRLPKTSSDSGPVNWLRPSTTYTRRRLSTGKYFRPTNATRALLGVSDIKPDNILLDDEGHAHLTDFNVAIHYSERRLHTSVAGSMAYMAPEVLARKFHRSIIMINTAHHMIFSGKGYTWHIDYWSLGVTMWEMLFHRRPFDGKSSEKLTASIVQASLKLPSNAHDICSPEGHHLLQSVSVLGSSC